MSCLVYRVSIRNVRTLSPYYYNAPWPLVKKGAKGIRKRGVSYNESSLYPGQDKYFPELSPQFNSNEFPELMRRFEAPKNHPYFQNHLGEQPIGYYRDPPNKDFVEVEEMKPVLVVPPDLKSCKLKPYVSFRTDFEIKKKEDEVKKNIAEIKKSKSSEDRDYLLSKAKEVWPPEAPTPELLFNKFYKQLVISNLRKKKAKK